MASLPFTPPPEINTAAKALATAETMERIASRLHVKDRGRKFYIGQRDYWLNLACSLEKRKP